MDSVWENKLIQNNNVVNQFICKHYIVISLIIIGIIGGIITLGPILGIEGLAWTHLLASSVQAVFSMVSMKIFKNR